MGVLCLKHNESVVIYIANRNRDYKVLFRVNEHERELIDKKMAQAGIRNREAYLRKMAIDGYIIHLDLSDVRELSKLLRNVTNNLNQIARRVNETGNLYQSDIEDLQERYDGLWDKAEKIIRSLGEM